MHPAVSVILFTVSSGAGFGLIIMTIALAMMGWVPGMTPGHSLVAILIGSVLATIGLLSSTAHLANKKNAWRAFFRFRSSWLSREGVFAVLFYPTVLVYLIGLWLARDTGSLAWWGVLFGILTALLALATVFCTGMIYASLRTIPQWNSALVPANYLLLAITSGTVILTLIAATQGAELNVVSGLALVLLVISGIAKLLYYIWIGKPQGPTLNTAMGITRAKIKILESGQSSRSFLNKEFSNQVPAQTVQKMRWVVYLAGFILPAVLMLVVLQTSLMVLSVLAVLLLLGGLAIERWLFFVEARHVVNVFYGQ